MGLGQPHVERQQPRLGAKAEQGQQERDARPETGKLGLAHGGEGVVPPGSLHGAEAEQDGDRSDVSNQQIEKSGAADFGNAVVSGDEEVGRQRHGLPCHHEHIRVIGQQHPRHGGEKDVILQAQQPRRRTLGLAEIAGGENQMAETRRPDPGKRRQGIQPKVKRQVGQSRGPGEAAGWPERRRRRGQHQGSHSSQGSSTWLTSGTALRKQARDGNGEPERLPRMTPMGRVLAGLGDVPGWPGKARQK